MSIDRGYGIATSSVLADSYDLDSLIADTEAAKVAALAAQVAAETAETNAETAETNASQSATNAATSETNIAGSEAVCAASEAAASASATAAATSETNASTSETNAGTSETNAGTSAANASTSETNASTSETNASNSASSASTSASTATTQASNASTSATNAASSETNAANSATAAATSETNIGNAEANCASSATSASASASSATTSAAQASTSATSASNSATTATTKASEASTSATNAATSATNAATSLTTFQGQYSSQATAPTSPTLGDLWFDTTAGAMKVYGASGWQAAGSSVNGVENSVEYTATAGQTSFTATYDPGYLNVFLNGVKLDSTDYTATDGSTVVLDTGAALNDSVFIQSFGTFELADHYSKTASDARFLGLAGGTMTGNVSLGDNVKANFGAGDDLQIYHDGSTSLISDAGAGNLTLTGGAEVTIENPARTQYMLRAVDGGAVTLFNAGATKLATTSTGIDVTGSVTCDGFTSTGIDDNATSTAITIDASENVGVGTTAPAAKLQIGDTTVASSNKFLLGKAEASTQNFMPVIQQASSDGTANDLVVATTSSNGTIRFYTGGASATGVYGGTSNAERARITNDGLTFNGDTAAANALDDYEEGTWTPTLVNGGTVGAINKTTYTKIGRLVTAYLYVSFTPTNDASQFRIGGLPFTNTGGDYYAGGSLGYSGGLNTSDWHQPIVITGGNNIYMHNATNGAFILNSAFGGSGYPLIITVTYETA